MLRRLIDRLERWVNDHPRPRRWLDRARRFTLPGFAGIPVYEVVGFIIDEIRKDQIPTRARSIAYSFFLAFFPAMIFLFTLLPYIPLEGFEAQVMAFVRELTPNMDVYGFVRTTIDDLLNTPREGMLSVGFLLTIHFVTQGVVSLILSFNKSYSIYQQRNVFQMRWVALKLTVILFTLFLLAVVALMAGNRTVTWLLDLIDARNSVTVVLTTVLRYAMIVFLFFLSISLIYYYGPATKRSWKLFTPGATLATILAIVASLVFSYYVSNFGRYNTIYGSLGTIILILAWLYANAFVLLIGFELNAGIYYKQEQRRRRAEDEEPIE